MENQVPLKKPKLTKKEDGFVKDWVETENGTQAALKNYDIKSKNPEVVAASIATENLKKPHIIQAVEYEKMSLKQALIKKGITPEYLADKVDVLLTATDDEGNDDYTAIDKGLKHATNIYGVVDPNDKPPVQNNTYNFIFSEEVQGEVKQMEQRIKDQLIKRHETS